MINTKALRKYRSLGGKLPFGDGDDAAGRPHRRGPARCLRLPVA